MAYNSYRIYPVGAAMLTPTAIAYSASFSPRGPNLALASVPLIFGGRKRAFVPGSEKVPPWPHLSPKPPPPPAPPIG